MSIRIKQTVAKLLNLARCPKATRPEAARARQLARRLMAKHGLRESDLDLDNAGNPFTECRITIPFHSHEIIKACGSTVLRSFPDVQIMGPRPEVDCRVNSQVVIIFRARTGTPLLRPSLFFQKVHQMMVQSANVVHLAQTQLPFTVANAEYSFASGMGAGIVQQVRQKREDARKFERFTAFLDYPEANPFAIVRRSRAMARAAQAEPEVKEEAEPVDGDLYRMGLSVGLRVRIDL